MKKIFAFFIAILGPITALCAEPLPFYVNFSSKSFGSFEPSDSDLQFDYNSENGNYEITVDYDLNQTDKFMRFYQKDGAEILPRNVFSWTRLPITANREYEFEIEEGQTSPLQIISFYGDVEKAQIFISIGPDDTKLTIKQIVEKEFVPESIYLWGSDNGGFGTRLFGELLPSPDDPYLFSADFDMPTWSFDPTNVMADFAANAFVFYLSTSNQIKKGTNFRAYLPYETEDLSLSTIALENGQTFTTTLRTEIQESCNISCITPGRVHLTFNFRTLEFTATMLDAMSHVTLQFDGIDTWVHSKYINVECADENVYLFVNPQDVWYWGDSLSLTISPKDGYAVTMECLSENATFELTEKDGTYTVTGKENGLTFLVIIENIQGDDSGIEKVGTSDFIRVFNLQGIPVASGEGRVVISSLPKGIYIINGKLINI